MMARVMKERCAECLFTPGRIVSPRRMAVVLAECRRKDTHFCCHKGTIENQDVWCHGWWMTMETPQFREMVARMHLVEYVTEQDIKDAPAYMRDTHDEGEDMTDTDTKGLVAFDANFDLSDDGKSWECVLLFNVPGTATAEHIQVTYVGSGETPEEALGFALADAEKHHYGMDVSQ